MLFVIDFVAAPSDEHNTEQAADYEPKGKTDGNDDHPEHYGLSQAIQEHDSQIYRKVQKLDNQERKMTLSNNILKCLKPHRKIIDPRNKHIRLVPEDRVRNLLSQVVKLAYFVRHSAIVREAATARLSSRGIIIREVIFHHEGSFFVLVEIRLDSISEFESLFVFASLAHVNFFIEIIQI